MKKNLFIATSIFFILIISSVSAISWSGGGVLVQGNITNISQLDDVDVSGVEDDDVLRWNDAVKKWVASKLNSILSFGDDYLFFSGDNEITFNETKLNETGDLRYVNIDGDTMTGNLNMGNNSLENVNTIYMNITGNDNGVIEGEITWNSNDHTLNLDSGLGPVNQVGYENWILVVNNEGVEIKDSQAVYFCGTQGNRPAVCLARADITLTSMVIGVATMDIPINQEGIITWAGAINNIDTSMFADNATFYLSATEAGNWTTTAPLAPNFPIQLGIITNSHAMQGSALIQIGPTDVTDGMVINSLTINKNFTVSEESILIGNVTTQNWFRGLFNWTTLTNWLSFDGSTLTFNETKLNLTIDARTSNVTGQWKIVGNNLTPINITKDVVVGNLTVNNHVGNINNDARIIFHSGGQIEYRGVSP